MIPREALYGYSPTGPVLTLVLPLALFVVVMIGLALVFHQPRTAPGRQPAPQAAREDISGAGEDTAVSETLVTGTHGGDDAGRSVAGRDPAAADPPSPPTPGPAVGDPASTEPPDGPD
jgi:hypothetical protein